MSTELQPHEFKSFDIVKSKTPQEIALMAMEQGYGKDALEVLERMLDLQMKHETNEARKAFAIDMVSAQEEMPTLKKTKKNSGANNSMYAEHEEMVRQIKPVYTKHGFSVSFFESESNKEDHVRLNARVLHKLGHSEIHWNDLPRDDKGPKGNDVKTKIHGVKSSITYGKGMLLCEIFNVPSSLDVDDDGNAAGGILFIATDQQTDINKKIKSLYKDTSKFWEFAQKQFGVSCAEQITTNIYQRVMATLKDIESKRV